MLKYSILLLIAVASLCVWAQQSVPTLRSHGSLSYPPLARQARVQGEVELEFVVNHLGDVVGVSVLSGSPLLTAAAEEFVRSWKVERPTKAAAEDPHYRSVIAFVLQDRADLPANSNTEVVIDSPFHVRVIGTWLDIQRSGCPADKEKEPPVPAATDYVEMSRSGCYGSCPVYTVRIHADGKIDWDGRGYVLERRKDSGDITSSAARDLITKFASRDFWALCTQYSRPINDNATTTFRVHIGPRSKTVSNYAHAAPPWLDDLEYEVDDVADTHHWLHGDPREEPLSNIEEDGYGPKPGLTPLMRAVARADVDLAKKLLSEGADPNQGDASGWTVLMYAKTTEYGEASKILHADLIPLLLKAGADPNYSSPRGDTPLMAAAYDHRFETAIARAGGNVNAQNLDGVSLLMILASEAEVDEIAEALRAGADPKLKDVQGRNALDYLRLANCGKNPLRSPNEFLSVEHSRCNGLDDDAFHKTESLLSSLLRGSAQ